MAKNKKQKGLLKESTIRRWALLGGLGPINEVESFSPLSEEDEEMDELPAEEEPELDMGDEEPVDMEPAGGDEAMVQDLVSAIADAITDTTGVPVDVEGAGGAPDPEMDMGGEETLPPGDDLGGEEEMPMDDEEPMMENATPATDGGFNLKNDPGGKRHRPGAGKSGVHLSDTSGAKKTPVGQQGLPNLKEEEDIDESCGEEDPIEEDAGADWKGEDQKYSKAKEVKPKAMYEVDDEMVAEIARRVAGRLLQEKRRKK